MLQLSVPPIQLQAFVPKPKLIIEGSIFGKLTPIRKRSQHCINGPFLALVERSEERALSSFYGYARIFCDHKTWTVVDFTDFPSTTVEALK